MMSEAVIATDKLERLQDMLRDMKKVIVAYSGGVDSTFLVKVAHDVLGSNAVAVTAVSPSLAAAELEEAKGVAEQIGVRHILLDSHEVSDPRYLANQADRCYFCKHEVYGLLANYARDHQLGTVVDGTNLDDLRDPRPGRRAAKQHGILAPLVDAGFSKGEIREAAKALGLPTWDKPAMACLSSRIPYGTPITLESLSQVERAELLLRTLGFRQARVRHHNDVARIEVEPEEFQSLLTQREAITTYFQALGYVYVTLDLEGYRTGSMNEALKVRHGH